MARRLRNTLIDVFLKWDPHPEIEQTFMDVSGAAELPNVFKGRRQTM